METDFEGMATLLFSDCSNTRKQECKNYFLDFAKKDISDYLHRCVNLLISGNTIKGQTGFVLLNMVVKKGLVGTSPDTIRTLQDCYRRVFGFMQSNSSSRVHIPQFICGSLACFASRAGEAPTKMKQLWEMVEKHRNYRYVVRTEETASLTQLSNGWYSAICQLLEFLKLEQSLDRDSKEQVFKFLRQVIADTKSVSDLHKTDRKQHLQMISQFIKLFNPVHEGQLEFLLKVLVGFASDPEEECQTALLGCYQQLFGEGSCNDLVFKHISIVFHNTKMLMDKNPSFLELWMQILSSHNFSKYSACVRDQLKTICQELMGILLKNIKQLDVSVGSYLLAMASADILVEISKVVHGLVFYNTVKRSITDHRKQQPRIKPSEIIFASLVVLFSSDDNADGLLYLTLLNASLKKLLLNEVTDPQLLMATLLSVNYLIDDHRRIVLSHPETTYLLYKVLLNILVSSSKQQVIAEATIAMDKFLSSTIPTVLTENAFQRIIELCQLSLFQPIQKTDISSKEKILSVVCKLMENLNHEHIKKIVMDSIGFLTNLSNFNFDELDILVKFISQLLKISNSKQQADSVFNWSLGCIHLLKCPHFLPLLSLCLSISPTLVTLHLKSISQTINTFSKTSSEMVMLIYLQLLEKGIVDLDIKKVLTVMIGELTKDDVEYQTKSKYLTVLMDSLQGLKHSFRLYAGRVNTGMVRTLGLEMRVKLPKEREKSDQFKCLVIECMSILTVLFSSNFEPKAVAEVLRLIQDLLTDTERTILSRLHKQLRSSEKSFLIQVLTYALAVCSYLIPKGQDQLSLIRQIHKLIRCSDHLLRRRNLPQFFIFYANTITNL